jgi:adenylosuccinate synthase
MPNVIVVGAQWGDEGKAKVVDLLAHQADVVVRCQGGCNAGHTVTHGSEVYKFHLIPSGLLYPNKTCVIGPGTVIDPDVLLGEMAQLEERGINLSGLRISDRAQITLPYHRQLDAASEKLLQALADEANDNSGKIGTTGKGIGPTYMDKVGRLGLRMTDILLDDATLTSRLNNIMAQKAPVLQALGVDVPEVSELLAHCKRIANELKPYIADTTPLLYQAQKAGEQLLFEGAQGTLLDVDHGTYPFVTSSNATSGGACTGSGVGPTRIDHTIGVMKAYTTRVGEGPFPTELTDANGTHMQTVGQEFGTTTGRQRRCGWFDGVMGLYSVMVNGLDSVALTKLDVLDDLDEVKICTGYRSTTTGELLTSFPATVEGLADIEAVYETLPGWGANINGQQVQGAQTWDELPANAKAMVLRLEEVLECPISMVSVGPERDATIIRDPQFAGVAKQPAAV